MTHERFALSRLRRARIALVTAAHFPVLIFCIIAIVMVLNIPGETVQVGPRFGPKSPISKLYLQAIVLCIFLPSAVIVLLRVGKGLRFLWSTRRACSVRLILEPGEYVVWRGSQGWHSIDQQAVFAATLLSAGPIVLTFWFWWIWEEPDLIGNLIKSLFPMVLMFPIIMSFAGASTRRRLNDLFGTMTVTDRRIMWCSPRGRLYHELRGDDLIAVAIVEGSEQRAWITVTKKQRTKVSEIDIFGVPHPAEALSAIEHMISSRGQQSARS